MPCADYVVPGFPGMQALLAGRCPELPFCSSRAPSGMVAVESLKAGATDYVLRPAGGLVPAVRRALGEAQERARVPG
jgi:hypothetical protein